MRSKEIERSNSKYFYVWGLYNILEVKCGTRIVIIASRLQYAKDIFSTGMYSMLEYILAHPSEILPCKWYWYLLHRALYHSGLRRVPFTLTRLDVYPHLFYRIIHMLAHTGRYIFIYAAILPFQPFRSAHSRDAPESCVKCMIYWKCCE